MIETIKKITDRISKMVRDKFTGEVHFRIRFVSGGIKHASVVTDEKI